MLYTLYQNKEDRIALSTEELPIKEWKPVESFNTDDFDEAKYMVLHKFNVEHREGYGWYMR